MNRNFFYFSFILIFFTAEINLKSQWTFAGYAPFASDYYFISVPDCNTIAIAGGTLQIPMVYLSTNGGGNFINIKGNITGGELYSVWAKNKDTIFVGDGGGPGGYGGNAKVWRTFNRGVNWSVILATGGSAGFINGIVFERPAQRFGVVFSDPPIGSGPCWYAKTYDGGVTWSVFMGPATTQLVNTVFCVDSLFYGFAPSTGPPKIFFTSNAGINWNNPTIVGISGMTSTVAFSSDKLNGIAGSSTLGSTIGRTTNGGVSWFSQSTVPGTLTGYCNMKWIWGSSICFLSGTVGLGGCIKISLNNGANWTQMTTDGISNLVNFDANRETNGINGWAVAGDGTLIKLPCGVIGLTSYGNNIPQSFKLEQNYPNPFNPVTKIRFDVPVGTRHGVFVQIHVYDILGHEISSLVNEELIPGTYEVEFDGSNYSSGMYYYKLTFRQAGSSTGEYSETKKMMLVK